MDPDEHRRRQVRAREAARGVGLAALLAISRCGGTHDRLADALWLCGLATPQPFVADLPGHWRAVGHVLVVVSVDGPVTAIVESEELCEAAVADEVLVATDLIAAAVKVLPRGRVGVLGADVASHAWWTALASAGASLEDAYALGVALRRRKSPAEQQLLRAAGRLGAEAVAAALRVAVPGARESDVAATLIGHVIREGGAVYDVALSSGAASVRLGPADRAATWTTRVLKTGDLLRIDAYGSVEGYLFDLARSIVVGDGSPEQLELIVALRDAVLAGVAELRPGVTLGEVARACEDALAASAHARRHGVPKHLMGGFWGHGLGLSFDPPWFGPQSTEIVDEGWCLALERRAAVPGLGGAQYEDDVLIGPDGAEPLTRESSRTEGM